MKEKNCQKLIMTKFHIRNLDNTIITSTTTATLAIKC